MRARQSIERERDVQRRIVDLLRLAGAEVIENRSQKWDALVGAIAGNRAARGSVDLIVAAPGGVTLWLECKRRGGRVTSEQAAHHLRLRALEHEVLVVEDHQAILDWADEVLAHSSRWPYATQCFARRLVG